MIISIYFREATFQGRQHFREYIVLETEAVEAVEATEVIEAVEVIKAADVPDCREIIQ